MILQLNGCSVSVIDVYLLRAAGRRGFRRIDPLLAFQLEGRYRKSYKRRPRTVFHWAERGRVF